MGFGARAGDHLQSPILFAGQLDAQRDAGGKRKDGIVLAGGDQRRAPAVPLQARDDAREILRLDDESQFLDDFDAAADVAHDFGALHAAGPQKEFLDGGFEIIRPVQQHGMGLGQALPDMLGHAQAEHLFDLATFQLGAQLFHGRDAELFIDALHALGIEPRIVVNAGDLGSGLGP